MAQPLADVLADLRSCRWVDLTHAFEPGIPHYHAFPDEQREQLFSFEEHGFAAHRYSHIGQWGTHMDPPSHFARDGRAQDEVGVEEMLLELVVLDVRERAAADPDLAVGVEVIEAHEAEHGRIPERAFVAFCSGWDARWPDGEAMANRDADGLAHYPGWAEAGLRLLVEERGVTAIGHDVTDTDPGAVVGAGAAPAETYLLQADRWQLELMADLAEVPPRGALLVATWPKPRGGTGFPARAFALVRE